MTGRLLSHLPLRLALAFATLLALATLLAIHAPLPRPVSAAAAPPPADLVLRGGRVVTMDDRVREARALAIRDGRIAALGTERQIAPHIGAGTRVIELGGALVIPGFIESHGHFVGLGLARQRLRLGGAATWDEVVGQVREAAARVPPGTWILGRGWHQEKWTTPPSPAVEGFPVHDALTAAAPDHPVFLTHASGHAAIANAKALELAGIGRDTPDPAGGEILRGEAGVPTGVLRETAAALVQKALDAALARRTPAEAEAALRGAIALATRECLEHGITTFHDAGAPLATVDLYRALANEGALGLRLWVMIRENPAVLERHLAAQRTIGAGDDRLTVRAIKVTVDGALGSRGAWLLEPYADRPGHTGLNTTSLDSLARTARLALRHGYQLCVHAIGDRANREVLDLYQRAFAAAPGRDRRWRIEHAQHLHPADIPRFAKLGVIASMQGIHCTSDAPWVEQRLGLERAREGAYVWRSLKRTGAVVINGTDAPVEEVSPIASFHASVTRRLADGRAWFPDQAMSRMEALRSYTRDAAWGGFEEDRKGRLAPGFLADVTVLSKDILTVPEDQIRSAEVLYTIVGGKVAWERPPASGRR